MRNSTILAATLVTFILNSTIWASPKIGDKAPTVKVSKWMTTKAPALPGEKEADKHVIVVEFWATWCGPWKRSIPHLAELHKNYAKDGLVIIGVSNEDEKVVEAFMKKGPDMPYHVAVDADMATSDAWTDDIEGIPHAFIVDKTSHVVWSGNPLDTESFDSTIKEVMAGKFDVEAAKKAAETQTKYDEMMTELQQTYGSLQAIEDAEKRTDVQKKVIATLEKLISFKPREMRAYLIKRQLLREFERTEEAASFDSTIETTFWDSENSMRDFVMMELGTELSRRNPGMMLRCARRANDLKKGQDAETLAVLAQVECEFGMIDEAIKHQMDAAALVKGSEGQSYQDVLSYYKSIKSLRELMSKG
ncbi:MAG: TlpA family protein disulfide reductase [Planctomycetes bacterium]|nr:TlpA family protein disulfide reductase [Planctomycetota bacterium]